jgi:hypothetical protein
VKMLFEESFENVHLIDFCHSEPGIAGTNSF